MTASNPEQPAGRDDDRRLLEVDGLSTYFPTAQGVVHAVEDVSLQLEPGETLGVVGESGSGKSVLSRTIMRLSPPYAVTSGDVRFRGRDLRTLPAGELRGLLGKDISMIFQDPSTALNPVHRIGRHLGEALRLHSGLKGDAVRARSLELLAQVGIPAPERVLRAYPHMLSGGMQQRVCIALAIASHPALLFADEPTTALDVTIQRQILDLLRSLQTESGMAMVLITHDLAVVAGRADRTMVMYGGRVLETAPTRRLFTEMRHPYTAALLASIPRLRQPSHTRLTVIPGRPVVVVDPKPGCRFALRCSHAQPRCLDEDPPLVAGSNPSHRYACFFPVGTPEGDAARSANAVAGRTAAGLEVGSPAELVS